MPYGKYTPKQKKLAAVAGDKKKITQADIITLKRRGMSIKKNIPARQKSFLARMGGVLKEVKGQKTLSPAYWSIRAWKKNFPL